MGSAENILILFLLSPNHRNSLFEPECSMQPLPREQGCFRHPVGFCLWAFTRPVAERRYVPQPCRQREMLPLEDRQTSGFPVVFLAPFHRNGRRLAGSSVTGHGAVVCSGVIGPQPGVHTGRNGHSRAPPSLPSRPRKEDTSLHKRSPGFWLRHWGSRRRWVVRAWAVSPWQPWSFRAWALERGRERGRGRWRGGLD